MRIKLFVASLMGLVVLLGCGVEVKPLAAQASSPVAQLRLLEETTEPSPTETVMPTATDTPEPTATDAPVPTATAIPTATPVPPTATPVPPTATPVPSPTQAAAIYSIWEYTVRDINGDVVKITGWSDGSTTKEIVPPTPTPMPTATPTPTMKEICGGFRLERWPARVMRDTWRYFRTISGKVDGDETPLCPDLRVVAERWDMPFMLSCDGNRRSEDGVRADTLSVGYVQPDGTYLIDLGEVEDTETIAYGACDTWITRPYWLCWLAASDGTVLSSTVRVDVFVPGSSPLLEHDNVNFCRAEE